MCQTLLYNTNVWLGLLSSIPISPSGSVETQTMKNCKQTLVDTFLLCSSLLFLIFVPSLYFCLCEREKE